MLIEVDANGKASAQNSHFPELAQLDRKMGALDLYSPNPVAHNRKHVEIKDILAIALPTLTVLVGILLNRNDTARLDARISGLESRMSNELAALRTEIGKVRDQIIVIRDDQREFYRTLGHHEIRLEKK